MTTTACAAIILALECHSKKAKKRKRQQWMKEWFIKRDTFTNQNLLKELVVSFPSDYSNFMRMEHQTFLELLELVTPLIQKENTVMRDAISANERLSTTLRFLATGQSFEELKFSTAISPQAIGKIVIESCNAIIKVLKENIKIPNEENGWKQIATEFGQKWNYPHCIGAMDGKHIQILKPVNSGSYYLNYKNTFSIVLIAVVNANYEFIMVDAGSNGRSSDGGVFANTTFSYKLKKKELKIPKPEPLPNFEINMPYVFVADDAFPLMYNIMKPYSRRYLTNREQLIFNYRLSRSRRIVENAFGIMASRFRILLTTINLSPKKACIVTLACCHLHNYLRQKKERTYLHDGFDVEDINNGRIEVGEWRNDQNQLTDLERCQNRNPMISAKIIRDNFCKYFNSVGSVPWQNQFVFNQ